MSEREHAFPELTDDDLELMARQIEKASSDYDMMGVLEEHVGYPVDSPFLMQFDTSFCPVDLGDAGIMYVFRDTAF